MGGIFLGKPAHWLLWFGTIARLAVLGEWHMQVRDCNGFIFVV